jgi:hypothetical protein
MRRPGALIFSLFALLLVTLLWAASPEAREPSRSEILVVTLISIKEWCDAHSPEFKARSQAAYDRWSKTNRAAISSLQQTSEYRDWLDGSTAQLTERHREFTSRLQGRESLAVTHTCNDEIIEAFDPTPMPEPVFATPQATWSRFLEALKNVDHQTAIGCLAMQGRFSYLQALIDPGGGEPMRSALLRLGIGTFRAVDAKTTELIWTSDGETKTTRFRRILRN